MYQGNDLIRVYLSNFFVPIVVSVSVMSVVCGSMQAYELSQGYSSNHLGTYVRVI